MRELGLVIAMEAYHLAYSDGASKRYTWRKVRWRSRYHKLDMFEYLVKYA